MSKATLLGIATQPRYDDNGVWQCADIVANIEVEAPDIQIGFMVLHYCAININITPNTVKDIEDHGYIGSVEEHYIMSRVQACLDVMATRFDGTERDADIIYDVIRLKMPRFISKSIERVFYSHNLRTGEIDEGRLRI